MGLLDKLLGQFGFPRATAQTSGATTKPLAELAAIPLPAGRISIDKIGDSVTSASSLVVTEPTDDEGAWRLQNLDTLTLANATPQELLDMLINLSPEISFAVWQFNRMCNPGYTIKVYELGGEKVVSEAGTLDIQLFLDLMRKQYGSFDVTLGRFFIGGFLRGAICGELVLDPSGEAVDLAAPDPFSVKFRRFPDPARGLIWQPGQQQGNDFVPLDIPTFKYVPIDPAPASPYGRSLAAPALFTAIFMLSLYHDIKRVVMQQGYKRMDIELGTEMAMDAYNFDQQGFASFGKYVQGAIDSVRTAYARLAPDDAFIHTDIFKLNAPAGTVDSDSINAIDSIMERLEKSITRALKSNGVVMDTSNNTNESDANRKWEIYSAGIKSIQHHCENMLEELFQLKLQAKGIQAQVEFRFAELRASEMFRDEQTEQLKIQNERNKMEAGWTEINEAANAVTGHDAVLPEPLLFSSGQPPQAVQDNSSGNELVKNTDETDKSQDKAPIDNKKETAILWTVPTENNQ